MLVHKYLPNYSVEDYNRWEGDWELIQGIPYSLLPSPVRKHQELSREILCQISNSINGQKNDFRSCYVVYTLDWIVNNNTVVRPDISVNCDNTGDFITKAPALIVEILAPSTEVKDKYLKFELYEEQGVKNYIIADPNLKTYQVYELINGHYQEKKDLSSFEIHDKCSIQINLDEALAELD
jgi:Uma2 family endonuclease